MFLDIKFFNILDSQTEILYRFLIGSKLHSNLIYFEIAICFVNRRKLPMK